MGTAGRSAPLRRTGTLGGLLGLEVAALATLHWLGRFEGLRIGWDEPVPWLLSSPVQEVLGALLRTVGLVMAYWLLISTLLYLLASLTRLPSAVRAVGWATLPMVRRVADHAVAVTLATSMVGGGTLGVAGPALAAADRGRAGPPARKPVAAAQATDSTAYGFDPAGPAPTDSRDDSSTSESATTKPSTSESSTTQPDTSKSSTSSSGSSTSSSEVTTTSKATTTSNSTTTTSESTTTTGGTTTTGKSTTTTGGTTTSTVPTTTATTRPTTTTERETTTTRASTSSTRPETTTTGPTTRPPAYVPTPAGRAPGTTSTTQTTTPPSSTSTTGSRPPAYEFNPATPSPRRQQQEPPPPPPQGSGGERQGAGEEPERDRRHEVVRGDNLWAIARERLAAARSGGSGEPSNREVAEYWMRVVEANRGRLRSGDPDLIYPGEEVILPPVE